MIFSRNRVRTLDNFANSDDVAGALGITGVSTAPMDWGVPQLSFNNFSRVAPAVPSLTRNQTYRFVDAVTYMLPKHTLTFGAELRRIENNNDSDQTPEGLFTFNGLVTSLLSPTGQAVAGTGLDFADFLLGYPYTTNERFGTPSTYYRSWATVGYASDDWRARSDFTVQFGVRYEFFTPPTELYGHLSNLDYDPVTEQVAVVIPGEAGPFSGALPSSLIRPNYDHWSPRIGIAWRPPIKSLQANHSMVVRAGYSLFYNESIYTQLLSELANQPPWSNSGAHHQPERRSDSGKWISHDRGGRKYGAKYLRGESELQSGICADLESICGNRSGQEHRSCSDIHGNERHRPRSALCAEPHGAGKSHDYGPRGQRERFHLRHLGREFDL